MSNPTLDEIRTRIFAKNRALYSGWSMELPEEEDPKPEEQKEPETPEDEKVELSSADVQAIYKELTEAREKIKALEEAKTSLETDKKTHSQLMLDVILGRKTVDVPPSTVVNQLPKPRDLAALQNRKLDLAPPKKSKG